jgi:FkbM family methyltransferase
MAVRSSVGQRLRVAARVAVSDGLRIVPLRAVEAARRRHLLVPVLRHRSIAGLGDFTVTGKPPVRLAAVDSRLVRLLYWYGEKGYEAHEVFWWRHFCERATGILEIGANVGYYTVQGALAAPQIPYTAVEAHPESAEIVRHNLGLNEIDHVRVVHGAVVGTVTAETVELALPDLERYAAPTGAFLAKATEGVGSRRASRRSISVPAVAAGSLIDGVDLVKLDIEGFEYAVLEPIVQPLVERRGTILVEVLRDTPKLRSLLTGMADQGYRFWLVSDPALREVSAQALGSVDLTSEYGSRDLAAIPTERTDLTDAAG